MHQRCESCGFESQKNPGVLFLWFVYNQLSFIQSKIFGVKLDLGRSLIICIEGPLTLSDDDTDSVLRIWK